MAQNAPSCKDTQDVQFKLHDKFVTFVKCGEPRSNVKLLAVSSTRGLLFAGNPTAPELKVILLKDLVDSKTTGKQPLAKSVPLPSVPNYMSCSSDGNLLAINFTQNGTSLLHIYAVSSFMTNQVQSLYNIRLAPEDYVYAAQLLWNPVLPNNLAVVLSNGGLGMYSLKEGGHFELHSLDKGQQVKCGCWSPKGKQIVLGFPNGKLQQFKPDLTPAKTLLCPPNVHEGPFDTLAIQWLSTYQFAVIFLQHGEDCNPSLYIMNAPKVGSPTYINYYDICYSLNGPRNHQFHFTHIPQWNLLLVTSANGVEVGVLATYETGDTPTWQQLTLLDEARIELPLSEVNQEETFPLGFAYDTSSTHQLIISEQKLPIMPMVYILGTDGHLLNFNFLNLVPGAVSVCSPPPPITNTNEFRPLDKLLPANEEQIVNPLPNPAAEPAPPPVSDISFAFTPNTVTSTPAPTKDKPLSLFSGFGANIPKVPASQLTFGNAPVSFAPPTQPAAPSKPDISFGGFGSGTGGGGANLFGGLNLVKSSPTVEPVNVNLPSVPALAPALPAPISLPAPQSAMINNTPLYAVPPSFKPTPSKTNPAPTIEALPLDDTEPIITEMIALQIDAFNKEIQEQKIKTRDLLKNIEPPAALRNYAKRLDDLQEINEQALDVDFELDVQGLRQGLNEAYAIVAECRGKLETYHQPDITRLMITTSGDPSGRRTIARLQSYLSANEAQLLVLQQLIDTQWEQFQDVVRRKSKSQMHIPCLEGIYQRLTRLQNLTSDQRMKQNNIKAKLKERGLLQAALLDQENNRNRTNEAVDNLANSILSLNLSQVVDHNRSKLSQTKLDKIRTLVQNQKISVISPQRPDRVGLESEVILETKRKAELKKKAAAAAAAARPTKSNKAVQVVVSAPQPQPTPPQLQKPTASKPVAMNKKNIVTSSPTLATTAPTSFAFSQSSPFVKTSAVTTTTATLSSGNSMFGGNFNFNQPAAGGAKPVLSFGNPTEKSPTSNTFAGFGGASKEPVKPTPFAGFGGGVKEPLTKPTDPPKVKEEITVETKSNPDKPPVTPKVEKPFSFGGLTGDGAAGNVPVSLPSSASPFSFGGMGLTLSGNKPTTGGLVTPKPNSQDTPPTPTSTPTSVFNMAPAITSSTTDPVSGLFSSVNICKPQVKETSKGVGGSTFTGFGNSAGSGRFTFGEAAAAAAGEPAKGLFGAAAITSSTAPTLTTTTTTAATTVATTTTLATSTTLTTSPAVAISTGLGTATALTTSPAVVTSSTPATSVITPVTTTPLAPSVGIFGQAATPATPLFGTPATTTAAPIFGTVKLAATAAPLATSVTTTVASSPVTTPAAATTTTATTTTTTTAAAVATTTTASAPGSTFSFSNAFSSLSTSNAGFPAPAATTTETAPVNPFGGGVFGTTTTAAAAAGATTTSAPINLFQSAAATTASSNVVTTAPGVTTTTTTTPTANIFGNVPKPEASVFGTAAAAPVAAAAPPSGLFAAAAATSPFGTTSPTSNASSGGNIFAQAAKPTGFGQTPNTPIAAGGTSSIFGGGSNTSPFGGNSIFGGGTQTPANTAPAAGGGGSIFGQTSVFGQAAPAATPSAGGNIFSNPVSTPQQPSPFGGGGGSIFGNAANTATPASGGSIFGGGNTSGGFGSFSQTTPTAGGFGSGFAQTGGASVAQTGFGSPPQQQATQQATPGGFGAKPVFGGAPAFGASPTFGGAPTFGSPKGFGGFGTNTNVASPPAFGAPAKPAEGNIFETLGGQESGLSFGNLAQTGNTNASKPAFGGSSFMNYR